MCTVIYACNSYAASNSNWMSEIDDSKYLSQISIPGTHDSAALYSNFKIFYSL